MPRVSGKLAFELKAGGQDSDLGIESSYPGEQPDPNATEDEYESDNNDSFDGNSQVAAETPDTAFSSRNASSSPRKKRPSELKTIACTVEGCNKTFNRQSRLETHIRSHNGIRSFVCGEPGCDKSYFDKKHLGQHVKGSHNNERTYECNWEGCNKTFLTGTRLRRHVSAHEKKATTEFKCTYPSCTKTFRKHNTLQRHIRADHMELTPYPCTYINPMTGEACDAGFDGAGGLTRHQDRVHGMQQFFCPDCVLSVSPDGTPMHLGFILDSQLQAHIKKEHNNCVFCDKKCSSARELQKHVESQHSGTTIEQRKTIPCTHAGCDKKFTKISNRNIHIQTAHEGTRFTCGTYDVSSVPDLQSFAGAPGCGQQYVSKANLEDHIRTGHLKIPSLVNRKRRHTTDPNEEDEELDLDFDEPPKRARNARSKRPKTSIIDELTGRSYVNDPKRTIACLVTSCPNLYTRDYDMKQHLRSKHGLSKRVIEDLERAAAEAEPEFQFLVGDGRNDDAYGEEGGDSDLELDLDLGPGVEGGQEEDWNEEREMEMRELENLPYHLADPTDVEGEVGLEWLDGQFLPPEGHVGQV